MGGQLGFEIELSSDAPLEVTIPEVLICQEAFLEPKLSLESRLAQSRSARIPVLYTMPVWFRLPDGRGVAVHLTADIEFGVAGASPRPGMWSGITIIPNVDVRPAYAATTDFQSYLSLSAGGFFDMQKLNLAFARGVLINGFHHPLSVIRGNDPAHELVVNGLNPLRSIALHTRKMISPI